MRPKPQKPGPGQESVWDYPRPPRLEPFRGVHHDRVRREAHRVGHRWLARARNIPSANVLPTPDAFAPGVLRDASGSSWCEWKGQARLLRPGDRHQGRAGCGVDVSPSESGLRTDRRCDRRHGGRGRPMHGQRGAGGSAARWLLRRLDHQLDRRPVQRHPRLDGLVKVVPA